MRRFQFNTIQLFISFGKRQTNVFNNGAVRADFFDATLLSCRSVHMQNISKNMQYISKEDRKITLDPYTMKTNNPIQRPLCVMMNWMLAKPKHVLKYANVYLEQDFDVVAVSCSPMQLMWPVKGSKIIAADMMKFLENNPSYGPLVVHGFSVGAYVWAELLVHSLENKERYQPVLDRVNAQIWDSPADVYEIPIGLPNAVFPKNKILQKALRAYTIFHMKLLNDVATKHYMRATQVYHNTPCRAPGLFLCSLTDPIGAAKRSRHAHDTWKSLGVKVNWKCWDKSPHIQHFIYHTEEYLAALYSHLGQSGVIKPIAQR
ncbi:uncharacterized protein LOC101742817 [Bombyx mori]|uniref:Transmembrane protein 53 n=1 Tax=Bombyx mori TaxID=7091 RepID=A0A8R2HTX3_BOMMO|nr:uncharacterized protein LOC101742817 [Bombyx mori]XP_021207822.1 uncharacterized protein LOC101742817 [Bombyx mori]XP_021207824.1 uncharacterized protein LOC101742817 [Bombyx mori]XP_021207825.1 uncharacterized protein LOC101742817 [Bombyx mori]XP_021207827.1 uncharacterized protein LOC101742817 [Bombyx mori]XP_037871233.1 uncharacterized protein LOC101742817 [Bombyx mori]